MRRVDPTVFFGQKFSRLTIQSVDHWTARHGPKVQCVCDCGTLKVTLLSALKNGDAKSCGCLLKEVLSLPTHQRTRSSTARARPRTEADAKRASQHKWSKKNKDKVAAAAKRFRERHKGERKKEKAEYYQRAKPKIYAKLAKRFREDINFRISSTIRGRIRKALRLQKVIKSKRYLELLGCSLEEFKSYLEALFPEGMTWDSIKSGVAHIDHKIPVRFFDMRDTTQQAACFHF